MPNPNSLSSRAVRYFPRLPLHEVPRPMAAHGHGAFSLRSASLPVADAASASWFTSQRITPAMLEVGRLMGRREFHDTGPKPGWCVYPRGLALIKR